MTVNRLVTAVTMNQSHFLEEKLELTIPKSNDEGY
jgi:hypothetical protein